MVTKTDKAMHTKAKESCFHQPLQVSRQSPSEQLKDQQSLARPKQGEPAVPNQSHPQKFTRAQKGKWVPKQTMALNATVNLGETGSVDNLCALKGDSNSQAMDNQGEGLHIAISALWRVFSLPQSYHHQGLQSLDQLQHRTQQGHISSMSQTGVR